MGDVIIAICFFPFRLGSSCSGSVFEIHSSDRSSCSGVSAPVLRCSRQKTADGALSERLLQVMLSANLRLCLQIMLNNTTNLTWPIVSQGRSVTEASEWRIVTVKWIFTLLQRAERHRHARTETVHLFTQSFGNSRIFWGFSKALQNYTNMSIITNSLQCACGDTWVSGQWAFADVRL